MYKNNIVNKELSAFYQIINELNEYHPLWWQDFVENIILNPKITFINHTTLIIGLYELNVQQLIVLYNIFKKFKKRGLLNKVINKKEFLIVHFNSLEIINYIQEPERWLNLIVYEYLTEKYDVNNLVLFIDNEETLRFIYQGTVYHFFTNPTKHYKSNKYHKYIYLYKNLYIKHLNLIDNNLKYIRNRTEFFKKFSLILEKTN